MLLDGHCRRRRRCRRRRILRAGIDWWRRRGKCRHWDRLNGAARARVAAAPLGFVQRALIIARPAAFDLGANIARRIGVVLIRDRTLEAGGTGMVKIRPAHVRRTTACDNGCAGNEERNEFLVLARHGQSPQGVGECGRGIVVNMRQVTKRNAARKNAPNEQSTSPRRRSVIVRIGRRPDSTAETCKK